MASLSSAVPSLELKPASWSTKSITSALPQQRATRKKLKKKRQSTCERPKTTKDLPFGLSQHAISSTPADFPLFST